MTYSGGRLGFCLPAFREPGSLVGVMFEGPFGSVPSVLLVLLVSVCVLWAPPVPDDFRVDWARAQSEILDHIHRGFDVWHPPLSRNDLKST